MEASPLAHLGHHSKLAVLALIFLLLGGGVEMDPDVKALLKGSKASAKGAVDLKKDPKALPKDKKATSLNKGYLPADTIVDQFYKDYPSKADGYNVDNNYDNDQGGAKVDSYYYRDTEDEEAGQPNDENDLNSSYAGCQDMSLACQAMKGRFACRRNDSYVSTVCKATCGFC